MMTIIEKENWKCKVFSERFQEMIGHLLMIHLPTWFCVALGNGSSWQWLLGVTQTNEFCGIKDCHRHDNALYPHNCIAVGDVATAAAVRTMLIELVIASGYPTQTRYRSCCPRRIDVILFFRPIRYLWC